MLPESGDNFIKAGCGLMSASLKIKHKGNWNKTQKLVASFADIRSPRVTSILKRYGELGVDALAKATPKRTGQTAASWRYVLAIGSHEITLSWVNDNAPNGVQVSILIQYGHATKNGGWIEGVDYINPTIRPIFEEIVKEIEREVARA